MSVGKVIEETGKVVGSVGEGVKAVGEGVKAVGEGVKAVEKVVGAAGRSYLTKFNRKKGGIGPLFDFNFNITNIFGTEVYNDFATKNLICPLLGGAGKIVDGVEEITDVVSSVAQVTSFIPPIAVQSRLVSTIGAGVSYIAPLVKSGLDIIYGGLNCNPPSLPKLEDLLHKRLDAFSNQLNRINDTLIDIQSSVEGLHTRFDLLNIRLDQNFFLLTHVSEMVKEVLYTVRLTQDEMRRRFDDIENRDIEKDIIQISKMTEQFELDKRVVENLSHDQLIAQLQDNHGILQKFSSNLGNSGTTLYTLLDRVISKEYVHPKSVSDTKAFIALGIVCHGVQTYVSTILAVLEQRSYLADYYYQKGDLQEFNKQIDLLQSYFKFFKSSSVDNAHQVSPLDKAISTFDSVLRLGFHLNNRYLAKSLEESNSLLHQAKKQADLMELPIIDAVPNKLSVNVQEWKGKDKSFLSGDWQPGEEVSYAMQYKVKDAYSKVGVWSNSIRITDKANPVFNIPSSRPEYDVLIFRKFKSKGAELVGVMEKGGGQAFSDINRDLYNSVMEHDLSVAKNRSLSLISIGADLNIVFEQGRSTIHAAAQRGHVELVEEIYRDASNSEQFNEKDANGYAPIHLAAESGNDAFIDWLCSKKGADINIQTEKEGFTALHIAISKGHEKVVKALIKDNLINPNLLNRWSLSPLHIAVSVNVEIVKSLMNSTKININLESRGRITPLHIAASTRNNDIIRVLMSQEGINVNPQDNGGMTPLHISVLAGSEETTYALLSHSAVDVNAVAVNGWTPLYFAISLDRSEIIEKLLNVDSIDVNAVARGGVTPLHVAATKGNVKIISQLLMRGALAGRRTEEGLLPVHLSAIYGHEETVELLLEKYSTSIEARTNSGLTPFLVASASRNSNVGVIKLLKKKEANMLAVSNDGQNCLYLSAKSSNLPIFQFFAEGDYKRDLFIKNNKGLSLLHEAAGGGNFEVVKYLLEKGLDHTARSSDNRLVLHYAAESGRFDVIDYLLHLTNKTKELVDINIKSNGDKMPLHYAAKSGSLESVKNMIKLGADINSKTNDGMTVLHYATASGNVELVDYLLDQKDQDIGVRTNDGKTVLHYAAKSGSLNLVRNLVGRGADFNARSKSGERPIHYASESFNTRLIAYLKEESGALADSIAYLQNQRLTADIQTDVHMTPLHYAARSGDIDSVAYLYKNSANVNAKTTDDRTPVREAAKSGNTELVKYLSSLGANTLAHTSDGETLLHYAAKSKNIELVKYMIKEGSDINGKTRTNKTPLHYAAEVGDLDIVKLLIESGASLYASANYNMMTLHFAAKSGNLELVRYLIDDKGQSIEVKNHDNETILHYATFSGRKNLVSYLINDKKMDPSSKTAENKMLLHFAAESGNLALVKEMIEKVKLSVYDLTRDRKTVLHFAAENANLELVKYLVKQGAKINLKDNDGRTPAYYAGKNGNTDLFKYLVEKETGVSIQGNDDLVLFFYAAKNVNFPLVRYMIEDKNVSCSNMDKDGRTVLHYAAEGGSLELVKYLIEKQGEILNAKDGNNKMILHYASESGNLELVKYLIEKMGVEYDVKTRNYETPLHFAVMRGKIDLIEYFIGKGLNLHDRAKGDKMIVHYLAENPNTDVFEYLLKQKSVNYRVRDADGKTILHYAVQHSQFAMVDLLLKIRTFDFRIKDGDGKTPLHYAAELGDVNMVEYIIKSNSSALSDNSHDRRTPFHFAASSGNVHLIKYLQEAFKGNLQAFETRDINDATILHYAAKSGSLECVEYLIDDQGVSLNDKDKNGKGVVHYAAESGNLQLIKYLVEIKRLVVNDKTKDGLTVLHYAARSGSLDLLQYLLEEKKMNIKDITKSGESVLHFAVKSGNFDLIIFLLEQKKIDVNTKDSSDVGVIHLAAESGDERSVRYMIEKMQADIKAVNFDRTLLHSAVKGNSLGLVKYLVEKMGFDVNIRAPYPKSMRGVGGGTLTLQCPKRSISGIRVESFQPRSVMEYAVRNGNLHIVKYLLEKGSDIYATPLDDKIVQGNVYPLHHLWPTAMELAARLQYFDILFHIVENVIRSRVLQLTLLDHGRKEEYFVEMVTCPQSARSHSKRELMMNISSEMPLLHNASIGRTSNRSLKDFDHKEGGAEVVQFPNQPVTHKHRHKHGTRHISSSEGTVNSGARQSSWINDLFGWVKSSVSGLLSSKPAETSNTTNSISQVDAQIDVNGTIMLLDVLVRKVTGQKYISTVDQSISPLEAQGYALNITKEFEKVVEQAGLKSGVSMHRLNIDYMGMQKEITRKVMSGKFNEISGILKSYVEKACPGEEAGKLSTKKFDKFMVKFNKGLLNQSIEHNRDGRLEVDGTKKQQISLEPQSYLSNASIQSHSKVSTCLSDIGVTKLGGNLNR